MYQSWTGGEGGGLVFLKGEFTIIPIAIKFERTAGVNRENCRITFHTLHFCFSVPKLLLRMNTFHDRRPTLRNITKRAKSCGAVRCNFGPLPKIPGANSSAVVRDINSLVPQGAIV